MADQPKVRFLALIVFSTIGGAGCSVPPMRAATPPGRDMHVIDSLFVPYSGPGVPGAGVVVIKDGRVVVNRSYGLADVETGTPASDITNYRLASLSKQFTATAIMLLARDGRLRYDSRVVDFLPGFPEYAREITVRHLLTHTSGLWDYEDFVPSSQTVQVKDRDVVPLLRRVDSTYFPAGSAYRYSNSGYAVLALIVETISHQPYATFLRERIFAPLGMKATLAYEAGISTVENRAFGYSLRSTGIVRTDQSSTSAVLGDGGVYSSIRDLVIWDRALDEGALLSRAELDLAWTSARLNDGTATRYGFGWFTERVGGALRLSHHGETSGFTNFILKYPERRLTVIVLTNRRGGTPWDIAASVAALPSFASR